MLFLIIFATILQVSFANKAKTGCDSTLSGANGTITSPNYPKAYPANTKCSWTITVASSMVISFQFVDFEIGDGDDKVCSYDKLAIQAKRGTKFKTFVVFCGASAPSPFETTSNAVKVVFSSDESENQRGFQLQWKAVRPQQNCGKTTFNATTGSIQSPSFPNLYPGNLHCTYQISMQPDNKIFITVSDIDIEYGPNCEFDSLQIREIGIVTSKILGKYCGTKKPRNKLVSNGPTITLDFKTDDSNAGRGFNVTWKSERRIENGRKGCGLKHHKTRIVGGVFAGKGEFPWQAAFFWRTGLAKGKFFCGGALISDTWVITAAHCFINGRDSSLYKVILGERNIKVKDGPEQEFNTSKIIIHKHYNMITHDNDIALVKLERSALLNDYVNTLCLPARNITPGSRCEIAGWGATIEHGLASDVLMKAEVPIVDNRTCSHNDVYGTKITRNMLCAGFAAGGVDTCQGDSGGPLICRSLEDARRWELQGIASWGRGCGRQRKYGVYAVVRNYLSWVEDTTNDTDVKNMLPSMRISPSVVTNVGATGTSTAIPRSSSKAVLTKTLGKGDGSFVTASKSATLNSYFIAQNSRRHSYSDFITERDILFSSSSIRKEKMTKTEASISTHGALSVESNSIIEALSSGKMSKPVVPNIASYRDSIISEALLQSKTVMKTSRDVTAMSSGKISLLANSYTASYRDSISSEALFATPIAVLSKNILKEFRSTETQITTSNVMIKSPSLDTSIRTTATPKADNISLMSENRASDQTTREKTNLILPSMLSTPSAPVSPTSTAETARTGAETRFGPTKSVIGTQALILETQMPISRAKAAIIGTKTPIIGTITPIIWTVTPIIGTVTPILGEITPGSITPIIETRTQLSILPAYKKTSIESRYIQNTTNFKIQTNDVITQVIYSMPYRQSSTLAASSKHESFPKRYGTSGCQEKKEFIKLYISIGIIFHGIFMIQLY